jgi:ABC-2 type transport system ATP-binding protein
VKKYEGTDKNTLDISEISFKRGTITKIIGANGIGKTTFLSILAGLMDFEGKISFDKYSINEDYQKYLLVTSYIGNDLFLYDYLTGREMIYFVQKMINSKKDIDCDLINFIDESGLSEYLDIFTKEMSLGTKQKLSIVLALLVSPKVLLLDEPFVNLDDHSKIALIKLLKLKSKEDQLIIIYATHLPEDTVGELSDATIQLTKRDGEGADLVWQ